MFDVVGNDNGADSKPATAARIYSYFLDGTHYFRADEEAAKAVLAGFPDTRLIARANRAFLRRAVRYVVGTGVRQFLDIGSGLPTDGNIHEVAQQDAPDTRVVYVDIDPVAVAESLDLLADNPNATAIRGDLRRPQEILDHPQVRKLLDFNQPIGLVLGAVLHFVPDDAQPYDLVKRLLGGLAPGSYLVLSHATADERNIDPGDMAAVKDLYRKRTTTSFIERTRPQIEQFFAGLELVEPGVQWLPLWRPDPAEPTQFPDQPHRSAGWAGVALVRPAA